MRLMLIGTDRALFQQGSAVRARITRFALNYTGALDSIVFSARGHGLKEAQELAPNVHAYPTNSRSRFLYGLDALRIARKLPRPDSVSAQDPFETGLAALLIARHFGVPLMIEMHTDFLSPSFAQHSPLNRLRVLIAGFVLRRAKGGYAVSERVKKSVVEKYKLKVPIEVLPIYVDLARIRSLVRKPQKGSLLWIGRFESEKNPALALHAFAAARYSDSTLRLTMLGAGTLEVSLKSLAVRLGMEEFVEFPGWQSPAPYLVRAELLLVTSQYEGYGMALVEALAAGVPVLSTDVGVAREAGAIIAPRTVEGYADALVAWLRGSRNPGILKLHPYQDEEEYFSSVQKLYASRMAHDTL